jgi:hypothetical protein
MREKPASKLTVVVAPLSFTVALKMALTSVMPLAALVVTVGGAAYAERVAQANKREIARSLEAGVL